MILEEMEVHQPRSKIKQGVHNVPPIPPIPSSTRGSSSDNDDSDDRDDSENGEDFYGDGNKRPGGMGGPCGMGGLGGMGGTGTIGPGWSGGSGGNNCCGNGMPTNCRTYVILDNDPRVHYTGPWTLEASQSSTTHSTVVEGSTASLRFNGKFLSLLSLESGHSPVILTLQVALFLFLALSLQVTSPSPRQLHTLLMETTLLSRHYHVQPLMFLSNHFIPLLSCHQMGNTYYLSMSPKPRCRML